MYKPCNGQGNGHLYSPVRQGKSIALAFEAEYPGWVRPDGHGSFSLHHDLTVCDDCPEGTCNQRTNSKVNGNGTCGGQNQMNDLEQVIGDLYFQEDLANFKIEFR